MDGKAWDVKAKHCWTLSTNILFSKVCWQHPAMFCLYTSSKLSRPSFEFSMKVKVMGSNLGYLFKSSLLYWFIFKVMGEAVHWPMSETEVSILTAPHPITFCRDQLSALCCHYISLPMQTRKVWKTSWLVWKFWLLLPGIHPLANAVCMAISCKLHTQELLLYL